MYVDASIWLLRPHRCRIIVTFLALAFVPHRGIASSASAVRHLAGEATFVPIGNYRTNARDAYHPEAMRAFAEIHDNLPPPVAIIRDAFYYRDEDKDAYNNSTEINCSTSRIDADQWYCNSTDTSVEQDIKDDMSHLRELFSRIGFTRAMQGTNLKQLHESDDHSVATRVTNNANGVTVLNRFEAKILRKAEEPAKHGYRLKIMANERELKSVNTSAPGWVNATTLDLSLILPIICKLKRVSYLELATRVPYSFGGHVPDSTWKTLHSCRVWGNLRGLRLQGVRIAIEAPIIEQCLRAHDPGIMSELIISDTNMRGDFHTDAMFRGPVTEFFLVDVPLTRVIIDARDVYTALHTMKAIIVINTQLYGNVMQGIIAQLSSDAWWVQIAPLNPDMFGTFDDAEVGTFCASEAWVSPIALFSLSYSGSNNARANITGLPRAESWSLCSIKRFELINLNLSGELPHDMFLKWNTLVDLRIEGSKGLHGVLPELPVGVKNVVLRHNAFRGPFPLSWRKLDSCQKIDLSHNNIAGSDERIGNVTNDTQVTLTGVISWGRTRRDLVTGQTRYADIRVVDPLGDAANWTALQVLDLSDNPINMHVDDLVPRLAHYAIRKISLVNTQLFGNLSDCTFTAFQTEKPGYCPAIFVAMRWQELDLSSNKLESYSCTGCRLAECVALEPDVSITGTFFPQHRHYRQMLTLDKNPRLARLPNYVYARFDLSFQHTAVQAIVVDPFLPGTLQQEKCRSTLPGDHCSHMVDIDKTDVCLLLTQIPLIRKRFPNADCYENGRLSRKLTLTTRVFDSNSKTVGSIDALWSFAPDTVCRCRLGWFGDARLFDNDTRVNCEVCGDNLYGVNVVDDTTSVNSVGCARCPEYASTKAYNTTNIVPRTSIDGCKCDPGRYMEKNECTPCPRDTFYNGTGATDRLLCHEALPPPENVENEWKKSYKSAQGRLMGCSHGTFQSGHQCYKCPKGYFSSTLNAVRCEQCPHEYLTTLAIGASSESECVCNYGYRALNANRTNITEPLHCVQCTKGLICNNGLDVSAVAEGYVAWFTAPQNSSKRTIQVFACLSSDACPGQRFIGPEPGRGFCASVGELGESTVDRNFTRPNPPASGVACAKCGDGYYWDGAICTRCGGLVSSGFCLLFLVVGVVFAIGLSYRLCLASTSKFSLEYVDHRSNLLTLRLALSSVLSHAQILMLLGSVHLAWNGFTQDVLGLPRYLFDYPFQGLQCQLTTSTENSAVLVMAAKNLSPFILAFFSFLVFYAINICLHKWSPWRTNMWSGLSLLFSTFEAFSVLTFNNALNKAYRTIEHPMEANIDPSRTHTNAPSSLQSFPSILVGSHSADTIRAIGTVSASLLIGGYFTAWLYIFMRGRSLIFTSESFRRFALDYFLTYDDRAFWFPMVTVLRRILLVSACFMHRTNTGILLNILCILIIALVTTVAYKPYRRYDTYCQEVVLLSALIFIVALGLQRVGNDGNNTVTDAFIVITIVASYGFLLAYFLWNMPRWCQHRRLRNMDGSAAIPSTGEESPKENELAREGRALDKVLSMDSASVMSRGDSVQSELQFVALFYQRDRGMTLETMQLMLHVMSHRQRNELQSVYRHFATSINGGYLGRGATRPFAASAAGLYDIMAFCGQRSLFRSYFSSRAGTQNDALMIENLWSIECNHLNSTKLSSVECKDHRATSSASLVPGENSSRAVAGPAQIQDTRFAGLLRNKDSSSIVAGAAPQIQDTRFSGLLPNKDSSSIVAGAAPQIQDTRFAGLLPDKDSSYTADGPAPQIHDTRFPALFSTDSDYFPNKSSSDVTRSSRSFDTPYAKANGLLPIMNEIPSPRKHRKRTKRRVTADATE